jgi:hypothetical protein
MDEKQMAAMEALLRVGKDEDGGAATFTAAFESDCVDCGDLIVPGEQAGYIGGATEASCWRCLP